MAAAKVVADGSSKYYHAVASPQEPLVQAVMSWCVTKSVHFVVAPYEADHQLIELQQSGFIDTILVASNDSDLSLYGGIDCIYE